MWLPGQDAGKTVSAPPPRVGSVWTASPPAANKPTRLTDNLIAALAYVTFIPAIVFLLIPSLRRSRFIRFHSWQSILFTVGTVLVALVVRMLFSLFLLIPAIGFLMAWLSMTVVTLGVAILWLVLLIKALQGEAFYLPLIGSLVEKA